MRLCGNLAMFLLLAWLAPRNLARREKGKERKQAGRAESGAASGGGGKFSGAAGERCTWTVSGEKQLTLKVTCLVMKKGQPRGGYTCEYTGEPALCSRFMSRPRAFWKQISRSLKQHLCTNAHETLQARMCKNGPARAHFRLLNPVKDITMTTPAVRARLLEDTPTTECVRRADHLELAQEKCGAAWASFCNFLFSMVQSRDC